jgi:hypothetical protein
VILLTPRRGRSSGDKVFHEVNLVLPTTRHITPAIRPATPKDVVDMLERWRQYITGWVFGRVFGMLSRDGSPL